MPNYQVTIERIGEGVQPPADVRFQTTEAQVNQILAGREKIVDVAFMTEVQRRGVHHYVRAIALGTNTSSVETAISAII